MKWSLAELRVPLVFGNMSDICRVRDTEPHTRKKVFFLRNGNEKEWTAKKIKHNFY